MGSIDSIANNISNASVSNYLAEANLNRIPVLAKNNIAGNEDAIFKNLAQIISGFSSDAFLKNASIQPPLGDFETVQKVDSQVKSDNSMIGRFMSGLRELSKNETGNFAELKTIAKGFSLLKSVLDDKNLFAQIARKVNLSVDIKFH